MASEVVWRAVTAVEKADRVAAMVGNKRWRKSRHSLPKRASAATEPDPGVCIVHIAPDLYKMLGQRGFLADD